MHYALTRLWMLPPLLARLGDEAGPSSPEGPPLCRPLLAAPSSLTLWREETLTEASTGPPSSPT